MENKHRILIVDDHILLRAGLRALLTQDQRFEVVGEAGDGREAIRAVGQLVPDLVLMDLSMPGMNGIEALTDIKRRYPDVRVLVMTLHKSEDCRWSEPEAGDLSPNLAWMIPAPARGPGHVCPDPEPI
jgi:DNA-binding NarL/FixJ family response regulator